jgi:hypothetical protein
MGAAGIVAPSCVVHGVELGVAPPLDPDGSPFLTLCAGVEVLVGDRVTYAD